MEQVGVKVTMIGVPPLATDLLGAATQASSADMIIAALGFTTCVPFARAIDQINYSKPVLSTPICTFLPRAAYAGGDIPEVDVRDRPDAGEPAGAAVEAVPEEGHPVRGDRERPALGLRGGRLGAAPRDREDHERDARTRKISPATITAGFKAFRGPLVLGPPQIACGKVVPGEPAACGNQTQFYNYVGQGKWKVATGWLKPPGAK